MSESTCQNDGNTQHCAILVFFDIDKFRKMPLCNLHIHSNPKL